MENSSRQLYSNTSTYNSSANKPVMQTIKETVVSGIGKAAQSLHQQADKSTTPQFTDFGHQTASWLEKSADYLQQAEPEKMRADFENQVRKNPAKSLLIAGAAGLALGIIFRGRR
jgi:ElaB/YqjD/DUF883 family membrane-anchored ribosome-binding protein